MSMKTWAESTLMISIGRREASSSASAVLPLAVGPSKRTAGGNFLSPTQEHLVQIGQRELHPGGAAVVALIGAVGGFHVAQQSVHLGHGERTVGAHCAMAG